MSETYRKTRRAALVLGGALLGFHMFMTALSQAPLSPAKMKYSDTVSGYLDPYFTQNWMLFAPTPMSENRGILARATCTNGTVSSFYDVSSRGIEKAQSSRFFPSRESRIVSNALQQLTYSDETLRRLREKRTNDKKPDIPQMPFEKVSEEQAVKLLSRYAYDQMPTACGGRTAKVQVRMYLHHLPPWSKRHSRSAEVEVTAKDFEWISTKELR
ncbi:DUF5819 family protein [Streptomyces syringium]|uniref:DUF5819 family protein n=1 Tax=Streptomyces syringium TaxID=76729 RepID=UPI003403DA19